MSIKINSYSDCGPNYGRGGELTAGARSGHVDRQLVASLVAERRVVHGHGAGHGHGEIGVHRLCDHQQTHRGGPLWVEGDGGREGAGSVTTSRRTVVDRCGWREMVGGRAPGL